ncbi:YrzI family small protein [Bacillus manliponensis]
MIFQIFFLTVTIERNTNRKTNKRCEEQYNEAVNKMRDYKSLYYNYMS